MHAGSAQILPLVYHVWKDPRPRARGHFTGLSGGFVVGTYMVHIKVIVMSEERVRD